MLIDTKRWLANHPIATVPPVMRDRITEERDRRIKARDNTSLESLQRETNRLLRCTLLEQEIQARDFEFRTRTGIGVSIDALVSMYQRAEATNDEAAMLWCRRFAERTVERSVDPETAVFDDNKEWWSWVCP